MTDPQQTLALCAFLKKRKAAKLGGQVVAYTNMVKGRRTARIVNEAGFTHWVKQRWPDEVQTVTHTAVNAAFKEKLSKQALDLGALIDGEGEVCPHVEIVVGEPYLTTKLEADAGIVIAGLMQQGRIGVDGLRELES